MGGVELRQDGNRALLAYWSALSAGRSAPYRAEVTAEGLGRALAAKVFIVEALGQGDLRFRLAGGALADLFGMELRGMSAPALFEGADAARFAALAERAVAQGAVAAIEAEAHAPGFETLRIEIALLPLLSDFGRLDRLLGGAQIAAEAGASAPPLAAAAPRRLRLIRGAVEAPAWPTAPAAPLAGFAEGGEGFAGGGALREVAGGAGGGRRRRDHLHLVKD